MDQFDISLLNKLNPCIFRYDVDLLPDTDDKLHFGFIAQDLARIFPIDKYNVVIKDPISGKLKVNYWELIGLLTKWQKQSYESQINQQRTIECLDKKINQLEKTFIVL